MKLKRYKKRTWKLYLSRELIIVVIGIILAVIITEKYANRFNDTFMDLAVMMAEGEFSKIINDASKEINFSGELFKIEKNNDNEIKMITYDSKKVTELTNEITNNIQNELDKYVSKKGYIIGEIPMGVIFKNILFRNIGPNIKIRVDMLGNIITELNTEVKPYGINNALVEVRVKIMAKAKVILPFNSKEIAIENVIPISIKIINGSIPYGYLGTYR